MPFTAEHKVFCCNCWGSLNPLKAAEALQEVLNFVFSAQYPLRKPIPTDLLHSYWLGLLKLWSQLDSSLSMLSHQQDLFNSFNNDVHTCVGLCSQILKQRSKFSVQTQDFHGSPPPLKTRNLSFFKCHKQGAPVTKSDLFGLMISEISVHGWLVPLL